MGNEQEGEETEVLGGNGNWGMDYFCLPPIQFESVVKGFSVSTLEGFLPQTLEDELLI